MVALQISPFLTFLVWSFFFSSDLNGHVKICGGLQGKEGLQYSLEHSTDKSDTSLISNFASSFISVFEAFDWVSQLSICTGDGAKVLTSLVFESLPS